MAKGGSKKDNEGIPGLEDVPEEVPEEVPQEKGGEEFSDQGASGKKGIMETLSDIYYKLEDKYYDFLDKLNEKIPVYKVIDPIDRIFPSFMLLMLIILILLLLLLFIGIPYLFSAVGPKHAVFKVVDERDNALEGVNVAVTQAGQEAENLTSDSFGIFEIALVENTVQIDAKKIGYKDLSKSLEPSVENENILTMARELTSTTISISVKDDESSELISGGVDYSFRCSGGGTYAPSGKEGAPSQTSVTVYLACADLSVTASSYGYEPRTATIDVALKKSVNIMLSRESQLASLSVRVSSADDSKPLPEMQVKLKQLQGETYVDTAYVRETDNGGSARFSGIAPGTYFAVAEDSTGIYKPTSLEDGEMTLIAGDDETVSLSMSLLLEPKKILLKLLDSATEEPIKEVSMRILKKEGVNYNPVDTKISNSDGFAEKSPLEEGVYSVVLSHNEYVVQTINDIALIDDSSEEATIIHMEKAVVVPDPDNPDEETNAGNINVYVESYGGNKPVEGATVSLFDTRVPFAIFTGGTGHEGALDFINLPPGTYYAMAMKGETEGTSDNTPLLAGEAKTITITLTLASIPFTVTVKDATSNNALPDAIVSFKNYANDANIGQDVTTNAQGKAETEVMIDKKIYVVVSKEGYLQNISVPYVVAEQRTAAILLSRVEDLPPIGDPSFDVQLYGVYAERNAERQVTKIEAGKEYFFKFNVIVLNNTYENFESVVRAGLEEQAEASSSNAVIKDIYVSRATATYSGCYQPGDNYADCEGSVENGAKQSVVYYSTLAPGIYGLIAKVYVKPGAEEFELRYGARGDHEGAASFRPNESDLYVFRAAIGQNICGLVRDDCHIEIALSLRDWDNNPVAFGGQRTNLALGQKYTLEYSISNPTQTNFSGVVLAIRDVSGNVFDLDPNTPAQEAALNRPIDLPIGNQVDGSFSFKTLVNSSAADINLDLGLNRPDGTALVKFNVLPLANMKIVLSQPHIYAGMPYTTLLQATELANSNAIAGAGIEIYKDADPTPILAGSTDSGGFFYLALPSSPSGTVFRIVAHKPNFVDEELSLAVQPMSTSLQGAMECLAIDPSTLKLSAGRHGVPATFSLTNNGCGDSVHINLIKSEYSDISLSDTDFDLANAEEKTITVSTGNSLGINPVYIEAKASSDLEANLVAIVDVNITDDSSCLQIPGTFEYDISTAPKNLAVANNCFSGYSNDPGVLAAFPADRPEASMEFLNSLSPEAKKELYNYLLRNASAKGPNYLPLAVDDFICAGSGC